MKYFRIICSIFQSFIDTSQWKTNEIYIQYISKCFFKVISGLLDLSLVLEKLKWRSQWITETVLVISYQQQFCLWKYIFRKMTCETFMIIVTCIVTELINISRWCFVFQFEGFSCPEVYYRAFIHLYVTCVLEYWIYACY